MHNYPKAPMRFFSLHPCEGPGGTRCPTPNLFLRRIARSLFSLQKSPSSICPPRIIDQGRAASSSETFPSGEFFSGTERFSIIRQLSGAAILKKGNPGYTGTSALQSLWGYALPEERVHYCCVSGAPYLSVSEISAETIRLLSVSCSTA